MGDVPLRLDADNPNEVDSGVRPATSTFMAAAVGAPEDPQQLLIFSGTAIIGFEIPAEQQENNVTTGREEVDIILAKNLANPADFRGSTTYATLASVGNDDKDEFGYRVTSAKTIVRPDDGALRLVANIAVGFDANFLRMSYLVFVLVRST